MVTANDTRVIDAEFAVYGPIGFDLGLFVGNLLISYFSQPGHESRPANRAEYGQWILSQIGEFWHEFVSNLKHYGVRGEPVTDTRARSSPIHLRANRSRSSANGCSAAC